MSNIQKKYSQQQGAHTDATYGLRMKKGSTIHDHLRQIDELSDQLAALKETVSKLNKNPFLFVFYQSISLYFLMLNVSTTSQLSSSVA